MSNANVPKNDILQLPNDQDATGRTFGEEELALLQQVLRSGTLISTKGKIVPGGITDRYLADYPNMYGDLSAGSGLNALTRDEDHARQFLKRHQDKLLYGSDCSDKDGHGDKCSGAQQIAAVKRLAPDAKAVSKMFYDNAARVLKIA